MSAREGAAPGQAAPDLFARWWRITNPTADDDAVTRAWGEVIPADHRFWTETQAAVTATAAAQPAPTMFATEALVRFADDGQWLTCNDDGTLDTRAELLAVKRAVREVLDLAARPREAAAQPAPGEVACEWCTHPKRKHETGNGRCFGRHDDASACKCTSFTPAREQPAPGLADAITERDRYRQALKQVREIVLDTGSSDNGSRLRRSRAVIRAALEPR